MKIKLKHKNLKFNLLWIIVLIVGYWCYKNITSSVFLKNQDKINIVFFGNTTRYYSVDRRGLDYYLSFPAAARMLVPGGYGYYRAGAINKLAALENKPDIIRRTFSWATSSMVDLYFYSPESTIFYKETDESGISPTFYEIFLNPGNANFVDRIFILGSLVGKSKNSYKGIELQNDFNHEEFIKDNMGIFYKRSYRNSQINVQIEYSKSYRTALLISDILDGEGIRVVDLTSKGEDSDKPCEIITTRENLGTEVTQGLKSFFGCRTRIGNVTVSDIILKLGHIERDWAIE
jgi:hypothetical protein